MAARPDSLGTIASGSSQDFLTARRPEIHVAATLELIRPLIIAIVGADTAAISVWMVVTSVRYAFGEGFQTLETHFRCIGAGLALTVSHGEHFGSELGERNPSSKSAVTL